MCIFCEDDPTNPNKVGGFGKCPKARRQMDAMALALRETLQRRADEASDDGSDASSSDESEDEGTETKDTDASAPAAPPQPLPPPPPPSTTTSISPPPVLRSEERRVMKIDRPHREKVMHSEQHAQQDEQVG